MTDYKIQEFQRLTKILELEKTLEQERQNLAKLRKGAYDNPLTTSSQQGQLTNSQPKQPLSVSQPKQAPLSISQPNQAPVSIAAQQISQSPAPQKQPQSVDDFF